MDKDTLDAVKSEVDKLAVGIGNAMAVIALLTIATSGGKVKKQHVVEFAHTAAARFRDAGDVVAATLLEQVAEIVQEL